ncbi:hypothetical protein QYE76_001925 [Lolium multiflorum]|uniref:Integrase catalytic domain-containing protein n=1 Tax=Lolium multiflorum TaxID=4521 RepID=A0AAD8RMN5_LOLMU|nr:hypothetical protein QYE76_001925 [Lolium multiflorum]
MHGAPHKAKTIISTTRCLELLHVDLFGPPSHESLGGKKYCLVIVDDYSRYCWVFFFKYKSETQRTMMEFANQVQRKYDNKILAIRSDNGTEFKNYTLDDFLGEEGIQHQYSTPYTPQQNGVAERKNRTLIEAARTMMMEYKSNYNFWAEAISTACHATNRLYFRKGLEKTPYEILTGNKPNVSYFKVFGCKCYVLIKDTRLSKFDSRAQEGIFVGYATDSHAYRVFNKSNGRVVESCDVTFDEDDRSLEERSASCEKGDAIPPDAIGRMGVGIRQSQELPSMSTGEGPSSTQVEPSTPQGQAPSVDLTNASQPLPQPQVQPQHLQQQSSTSSPQQAQEQHLPQAHLQQQPTSSDQGQASSSSPNGSGVIYMDNTIPSTPESSGSHDDDATSTTMKVKARSQEAREGCWWRSVVRRNTSETGANVEPAQHNQSTLPQRNSEVVNLTGLLKTND